MPQSETWIEGGQFSTESGDSALIERSTDDDDCADDLLRLKGKRQRASWHQKSLLERVFQTTQYPDLAQRNQLSTQLGMSPRKIQIWFQNRRTKEKVGKPDAKVKTSTEAEDVPGTDVNIQNKSGNTLLFIAASMGHSSVSYLLARGATQQPNHAGQTPLFVAIQNGHEKVVRVLLEHKASNPPPINIREFEFGESALHVAALKGSVNIVRLLLSQEGIQVNNRDYENYTPLHHSCISGHKEVCEVLLQHNADVNVKSSQGYTPLHAASLFGDASIIDLLLKEGAEVNAADSKGFTALCFAVREGHEEVVLRILSCKPSLENKTEGGLTALLISTTRPNTNITRLLLEHGADTTATTDQRHSIAHLATQATEIPTLQLLLQRGVSFWTRDSGGNMPEHYVREKADDELTRFFDQDVRAAESKR